jgi:integrase
MYRAEDKNISLSAFRHVHRGQAEISQKAAGIGNEMGRVFRAVSRHGTPWGKGISENVIWYVVRRCAEQIQLDHLAPHDLRRTCAKLCHINGGELEQIQFLLGHVSVLTTERYLGCKQNLEEPVNDRFGCLFTWISVDLQ